VFTAVLFGDPMLLGLKTGGKYGSNVKRASRQGIVCILGA
jgi:hypothetical protein